MNSSEIASQLADVYLLALPETVLVLAACVLFIGGTFRTDRQLWARATLVILIVAAIVLGLPYMEWVASCLPGALKAITVAAPDMVRPLVLDWLAIFIKVISLVGGAVLVLFSWEEVPDDRAAEYYGCLLMIVAGLSLTGMANDLVMLFLSLELISIPTYVILYLQRTDTEAQESAAKYFLLSVFSAGILLFGFSYLYGVAGTTNLTVILKVLGTAAGEANRLPLLALVALVMIAAGLGFKITAVPFHFYAPDVYQGTTLSSAALLAFVPKVAGFVALVRVLGFVWPQGSLPGLALGTQAPILFWLLAAMTMTVGNILALLQDNLKRLLAYSSVAHAGYMLIGLAVAPDLTQRPVVGGVEAVLFYLVAYTAMTVGLFAALAYLNTPKQPIETIDDLAGMSRSQPGVTLLMALFLFSLIGMPATAGFYAKYFLFFGALSVKPESAGDDHAVLFRWLAVIAAINAAIGAWYYLRIVAAMYLRTPIRPLHRPPALPGLAALWICALVILVLGIYPQPMVNAVRAAIGGQ
jgi:NADH-quinone oxidoreductase subunit N